MLKPCCYISRAFPQAARTRPDLQKTPGPEAPWRLPAQPRVKGWGWEGLAFQLSTRRAGDLEGPWRSSALGLPGTPPFFLLSLVCPMTVKCEKTHFALFNSNKPNSWWENQCQPRTEASLLCITHEALEMGSS